MGRERTTVRKYVCFWVAGLIFSFLFGCAGTIQTLLHKDAQRRLLAGQKLLAQKNYDGALNEFQKVLSLHPPKPVQEEALFDMGLVYAHFGNPKRDYGKSVGFFLKILNDYPESRLLEQAKVWVGVLQANLETTKSLEKLKASMKDRGERKEKLRESRKMRPEDTRPDESEEGRQQLIRSQKLLAQGNYEGAVAEGQRILASADPKSSRDEALFSLGLIYAHSGNPQRDLQKSLEYFKRLIQNYPKSPFVEQAKVWIGILEENEELNYLIQKLKQVDIDIEEMKRNRPQQQLDRQVP
jgi:outer membrane protein assembly factor BamD (BamD/ComL family)